MKKRFLVSVVPLLLTLGACGDGDETSSTSGATADTASEGPQLTFTGSDCVYEGPDEVAAGVVTVEFVNDSDGLFGVLVGLLDEGKTVEDVADYFDSDPEGWVPAWITDMGGQSPAKAGDTVRWESSLAAGAYTTLCASSRAREMSFGGGFTVVEN